MTRLLVSVRDAEEAVAALAGGADLIDIKEPQHGSLGAAEPSVWDNVRQVIGGRRPMSVALGELLATETLSRAESARGAEYAKVGLAGCRDVPDWQERWRAVREALPAEVTPVAVHYADQETARSPALAQIVETAVDLGCTILLVDTFDKRGGGLVQHAPRRVLDQWCTVVRQHRLQIVLGGSLHLEHLPEILIHHPDYVAVRGAVCDGSRTGPVSQIRVQRFQAELAARPLEGGRSLAVMP